MTDLNSVSTGSNVEEKPKGRRASRARRAILVSAALVIVLGIAGFVAVDRSGDTARQGTIATGHYWIDVSVGQDHMLGIDQLGNAWAWGKNDRGQLGDGTTTAHAGPVMVSGGHKFQMIEAGGKFSVGLDKQGKIWSWGKNSLGQLGDGTQTQRLTPVRTGDKNYISISAGVDHVVAIRDACNPQPVSPCNYKGDGWGSNASGQLAIYESDLNGALKEIGCPASTTPWAYVLTPTELGFGSDDSHLFEVLSAGANITVGLEKKDLDSYDGRLLAWGDNQRQALGMPFRNNQEHSHYTCDMTYVPNSTFPLAGTSAFRTNQLFTSIAAGENGYMLRRKYDEQYFVVGPEAADAAAINIHSSNGYPTRGLGSYTAGAITAGVNKDPITAGVYKGGGGVEVDFGWHSIVMPHTFFTKVRTFQASSNAGSSADTEFQRFAAIDSLGQIWTFDEWVNDNTRDSEVVPTLVADPS
jgi:alpha-tubulin suppressor-like RCC1 family protein